MKHSSNHRDSKKYQPSWGACSFVIPDAGDVIPISQEIVASRWHLSVAEDDEFSDLDDFSDNGLSREKDR